MAERIIIWEADAQLQRELLGSMRARFPAAKVAVMNPAFFNPAHSSVVADRVVIAAGFDAVSAFYAERGTPVVDMSPPKAPAPPQSEADTMDKPRGATRGK